MNEVISVIIPVYNVEQYLERCLRSVVNQTYKNLQIILIDDGSTDQSPLICDNWEKRDSRIQVLHQNNGGLSAARNTGLACATGEYIAFVDSDDWLELDMYSKLVHAMHIYNADIAMCAADSVDESGKSVVTNEFPGLKNCEIEYYLFENKEDIIKAHLARSGKTPRINAGVWNKLYKSDVVKDILFPEGRLYEDVYTMYKYLHRAEKMVYVKWHGYNYFQRQGSICNNGFSLKSLDALDANLRRYEFIKSNYLKLELLARIQVLDCCFNLALKIFRDNNINDYKEVVNRVRNVAKEFICFTKEYPLKRIIALKIFQICPLCFGMMIKRLLREK